VRRLVGAARQHARMATDAQFSDATRTLLTALDETWERGWQPADVVHVVPMPADGSPDGTRPNVPTSVRVGPPCADRSSRFRGSATTS
jgi:hypothetical protein